MNSNGTACFVTNLDLMLQPDEARSIVMSHANPIGSEVVPIDTRRVSHFDEAPDSQRISSCFQSINDGWLRCRSQ